MADRRDPSVPGDGNGGGDPNGSSGREILPEIPPAVIAAVEKTTRFSREFLATMFSLVSAAFGLVAALAWNTAITKWLSTWLTTDSSQVTANFIYAIVVTLVGVVVIVLLARVATRIKAAPIEFKYPGLPSH